MTGSSVRPLKDARVSGLVSASRRKAVQTRLVAWFQGQKRDLPWRKSPSPYAVWVSEVMLQQTRVEVVKDYFLRFMDRFPTLSHLAQAEEEEVLRLFQGLGYYSRARRLHLGAKYVLRECSGVLPSSIEELLKIPGIGPYSAGALGSIAFQKPVPLVDGNVIRVLTRLFCLSGDPQKEPLKSLLWALAAHLVPEAAPGDFNQGLMELGALVCSPKNPSCYQCPLRGLCEAEKNGVAVQFPELPKKPPPVEISMVVVLVRYRGKYVISRLGADARWWRGLYAFPTEVLGAGAKGKDAPEKLARRLALGFGSLDPNHSVVALDRHKHAVTKYKITLHPFVVRLKRPRPGLSDVSLLSLRDISELGLPAPHRRLLAQVRDHESG